MNSLVVEGVTKTYKQRCVVDKVSFSLKSGEIIGLLGPNGAGKTTSFYMVLGIVKAESGKIYLNKQDITGLPIHSRAKLGIGYLPQEPSVFRKLTVANNILAILETRDDLSTKERNIRLEDLLNEFNLIKVRNTLGISLSGGERRRVEIARSLAMEPSFILLDEPFAGIDPISIGDIQAIIKHLTTKNICVIITDHNVRETLKICDSATIMNEGSIICSGTPQEIVNNDKVKEIYLGKDFAF